MAERRRESERYLQMWARHQPRCQYALAADLDRHGGTSLWERDGERKVGN